MRCTASWRRRARNFARAPAGGIVMNVNNGEILAMASLPDAETPDLPADPDLNPRRNRMTQDVYELGSVFKLFTFALAVEDHTVRMDEYIPTPAGLKMGRYTIRDAERLPSAMMARDVLAESSNVGTAQIGLRSGPERAARVPDVDGSAAFGEDGAAGNRVADRTGALGPDRNGDGELRPRHFGEPHCLVNGGRRIQPSLLRQPADTRGTQVIKPETSAQMRELLRYIVTNGTGKKADVVGYEVGGKTGSAEKPGKHGYVEHKLLTSFCAVFPISKPRYLVFVMMDEPHGNKSTFGFALAGYTAAPAAGRVIARIAPMLGVPAVPPPPKPVKENS